MSRIFNKKPFKNLREKYNNNKSFKKFSNLVVISLFILFGVWLTGFSLAKSNESSNTKLRTEDDCSHRVKDYTYEVPFGNAVWNQPVCGLDKYDKSDEYVSRLLKWGSLNNEPNGLEKEPSNKKHAYVNVKPGFPKPLLTDPEGLSGLFTTEVYRTSEANTTTKVQTSVYSSNLDGINLSYGDIRRNLPDTAIPWNKKWRTGEGGDNAIVIIDDIPGPTEGRMYKISGYKRDFAAVTQCGPLFRDERICTYSTTVARDLEGNYIDYRTYEGFLDQRGVGLSAMAGMVTAEEVKAGEIRHALGLVVPNTSFGPKCSDSEKNTNAEGNSCGVALAPASKHEWGHATDLSHATKVKEYINNYTLDKTIPEGIRYALNISYEEIEQWLNSRSDLNNNPRRKESARIFATALKNYGMMIVDTNSSKPGIQTEGGVNPRSAKLWKEVGMGPDESGNLLKGLINHDNLYVVEPPTLTCRDGSKSKYSCRWVSAEYDDTQSSNDTPNTQADQKDQDFEVSLSAAALDETEPGKISINAVVQDYKNGEVEFEVFSNEVSVSKQKISSNKLSWTWENVPKGKYILTVSAKNRAGSIGTSKPTEVTINSSAVEQENPVDNSSPPTEGEDETKDDTGLTSIIPSSVVLPKTISVSIGWNSKLFEFHQAANLTWGASSSPNGIQKYIVKKNGKIIYQGQSRKYTDFAINNNQKYRYEVTAIDSNGKPSLPSVFEGQLVCEWFGWSCSFK